MKKLSKLPRKYVHADILKGLRRNPCAIYLTPKEAEFAMCCIHRSIQYELGENKYKKVSTVELSSNPRWQLYTKIMKAEHRRLLRTIHKRMKIARAVPRGNTAHELMEALSDSSRVLASIDPVKGKPDEVSDAYDPAA